MKPSPWMAEKCLNTSSPCFAGDEAAALLLIEELHSALCHRIPRPYGLPGSGPTDTALGSRQSTAQIDHSWHGALGPRSGSIWKPEEGLLEAGKTPDPCLLNRRRDHGGGNLPVVGFGVAPNAIPGRARSPRRRPAPDPGSAAAGPDQQVVALKRRHNTQRNQTVRFTWVSGFFQAQAFRRAHEPFSLHVTVQLTATATANPGIASGPSPKPDQRDDEHHPALRRRGRTFTSGTSSWCPVTSLCR